MALLNSLFQRSQSPDLKTSRISLSSDVCWAITNITVSNGLGSLAAPPHECSTLEGNVGAPPAPGASRDRPCLTPERNKAPSLKEVLSVALEDSGEHRPLVVLPQMKDFKGKWRNVFSIRKRLGSLSSFHMCKHTQGQAREMPRHRGGSARFPQQ